MSNNQAQQAVDINALMNTLFNAMMMIMVMRFMFQIMNKMLGKPTRTLLGGRQLPPGWTPYKPQTVTYVSEFPKCDFCSQPAKYDARVGGGSWAYMCEKHFMSMGIGLGTGKGQKLLLRETKPQPEKELTVTMSEEQLEQATMEDMWYPTCPYCGAETPAEPDATSIYCQSCNRRFKISNVFFKTIPTIPKVSPKLEPMYPVKKREIPKEIEYFPDSMEFLAYTIQDIGYADKLENAFKQRMLQVRGV